MPVDPELWSGIPGKFWSVGVNNCHWNSDTLSIIYPQVSFSNVHNWFASELSLQVPGVKKTSSIPNLSKAVPSSKLISSSKTEK